MPRPSAARTQPAREGDILQIVRTWTFTNDSLETAAVSGDGASRK